MLCFLFYWFFVKKFGKLVGARARVCVRVCRYVRVFVCMCVYVRVCLCVFCGFYFKGNKNLEK